jgi:hypothetical protein
MGLPITWRNVEAPDFSGASRMLSQAQVGFNNGFAQFQDILKNQEATAESNWKVTRDNNTQAFLDSVNRYRTPEEYQAALESGALDVSRFGPQIDRSAARNALDGRLSILQDRTTKANQFADQIKAREAQPIIDQLSTMAVSDDKDLRESAKKALGIYTGHGMVPKAGELAAKIDQAGQMFVDRERGDVTFNRAGEKHSSDLLTAAAHRNVYVAQANNLNAAATRERSEGSATTAALKAELAAAKAQKGAAELLIKNSPLDAGTMDTYEGKKKFADGLKSLGITDPEVVDSIHQSFSKDYGNGVLVGKSEKGDDVRIGLPVATALAAVEGAKTDWMARPNWLVGSGRGGRASERVKALMSEPSYIDSLQKAMQAQGIQYRALNTEDESPVGRVSTNSRRSVFPQPTGDDDFSGSSITQQAIAARLQKAKELMTPQEIEAAKSGRISPRVMKILQGEDER